MDERYEFYEHTTKEGSRVVVAVTHDAGQTVRATAKCSPEDEFDLEKGKRLALARCRLKVLTRRKNRARQDLAQAEEDMLDAIDARDYEESIFSSTLTEWLVAAEDLAYLLKKY